jgi:hypothetical protein
MKPPNSKTKFQITPNLDASIFKNNPIKRISESFQVQFRAEALNLLNRSNMQPPYFTNLLDAPPIGLIQGTQTTSRQVNLDST